MATCEHLREQYSEIYQVLGRYHERILQSPNESQKKIAALNMKNMLAIFTIELNRIIGLPAH